MIKPRESRIATAEDLKNYSPHGEPSVSRNRRSKSVDGEKRDAAWADPATEADKIIKVYTVDGMPTYRYWSGSWWLWENGRYEPVSKDEVRAVVVHHLNRTYSKVGTAIVNNIIEQLKAKTVVRSKTTNPSWFIENKWKSVDIFATQNALIHLPSFVDGRANYMLKATPRYFNTNAVDYQFNADRPLCPEWNKFLKILWPDDTQSIQLLQEWFGYCLVPDTRQQKILEIIGARRSGKGTIARVQQSLLGEQNICGPTLASLQTNFGMWPMLGKSLAIIADARLSGRNDQAAIIERLLSISGEDAQTIDRKNLEPLTTKLSTRIMIISNDLPRLEDASGALVGRMLLLQTTQSFYGKEDKHLTERLITEREGILHWAIEGWARLRERGHFVQPDSSLELLQQMEELSSPITAFIRDVCEIAPFSEVECSTLFDAWKSWCEGNGRSPSNAQVLGRDLRSAFPALRTRQKRAGAHTVRVYEGISIL